MACAKSPDPDHTSPPAPPRHPVVNSAIAALRQIDSRVRHLSPGKELDLQLARAQRVVDRARSVLARGRTLQNIENQLKNLREMGQQRELAALRGPNPPPQQKGANPPDERSARNNWNAKAAERASKWIARALTEKSSSQHKDVTERVTKHVYGNQDLSAAHKEQFSRDLATVLKVNPDPLGLVKEATLRGQRQPLASRGKLQKGTGTAYEIMGTAALIRHPSKATNTEKTLSITPGQDRIAFGDKIYLNREPHESRVPRTTIERDTSIWNRIEGREIGIDFKHVQANGAYGNKGGLESQIDNVLKAINHGQLHEYHFVTNGHFSKGFRDVVEAANQNLDNENKISLHENVRTLR